MDFEMFDWTVSFGNALTIFILGVGGLGFVYTIRGRVDALAGKMEEIEVDLKKMVEILVEQGKHSERMAALDARVLAQGGRLDDLTKRFNRRSDRGQDSDTD